MLYAIMTTMVQLEVRLAGKPKFDDYEMIADGAGHDSLEINDT